MWVNLIQFHPIVRQRYATNSCYPLKKYTIFYGLSPTNSPFLLAKSPFFMVNPMFCPWRCQVIWAINIHEFQLSQISPASRPGKPRAARGRTARALDPADCDGWVNGRKDSPRNTEWNSGNGEFAMWIQYDSTEMGISSTKIDEDVHKKKEDRWLFHKKTKDTWNSIRKHVFFRFTLENSGTIREWLGFDHQAWIGGNEWDFVFGQGMKINGKVNSPTQPRFTNTGCALNSIAKTTKTEHSLQKSVIVGRSNFELSPPQGMCGLMLSAMGSFCTSLTPQYPKNIGAIRCLLIFCWSLEIVWNTQLHEISWKNASTRSKAVLITSGSKVKPASNWILNPPKHPPPKNNTCDQKYETMTSLVGEIVLTIAVP